MIHVHKWKGFIVCYRCETDGAAGESLLSGDNLHGGGLPGSVVSQQTEHLAAVHSQRQAGEGRAPRALPLTTAGATPGVTQLVLLAKVLMKDCHYEYMKFDVYISQLFDESYVNVADVNEQRRRCAVLLSALCVQQSADTSPLASHVLVL